MNKQISFTALVIALLIVVSTLALQAAYAWSLHVDLSRSAFGMKSAFVILNST